MLCREGQQALELLGLLAHLLPHTLKGPTEDFSSRVSLFRERNPRLLQFQSTSSPPRICPSPLWIC